MRAAEKAAARDTYQLARATADSDDELRAAMAVWARALDRVNRTAAQRRREVVKARVAVTTLEGVLHTTEREEQAARMHADQAEAACLDARVRLAACEEQAQAPAAATATVFEPHAATGGHAVAISATGALAPLVIESIVSGDRVALELAASRIAEHTGLAPATIQLQLQELLDAVLSAAAEDGYLVFDAGHPFWAGLSFEEARDVVNALARLGFIFEPAEGWHAGRAPGPSDLSLALAYAGLDARNMRDLPSAADLLAPAQLDRGGCAGLPGRVRPRAHGRQRGARPGTASGPAGAPLERVGPGAADAAERPPQPGVRARLNVSPAEVEPLDHVRFQALGADESREGHGVGCGRHGGIDGRDAALAVIDMVDEAVVTDDDPGVVGGDGVRPEGAQDAYQLLAHGEIVGERAFRLVEEGHRLVAEQVGRMASGSGR